MTCISRHIVQALDLQPIGMRPMVSTTQQIPVNVFLVDLLLPFGADGLYKGGIQVLEFVAGRNSPFQALIGRDMICEGIFALGFDGHFTLCL